MGAASAPIFVSDTPQRAREPAMSHPSPAYRPCVGITVINTSGLVWVGRRADGAGEEEGRGQWWQMPQGGIDPDEDPADAALRELIEETGIHTVKILGETSGWLRYDLPPHLVGKAWGGRYVGQDQKWFAVRFLGEESEIDINPAAGHKAEFTEWQWVPLAEVADLIVPFKREVYLRVVAAFSAFAVPGC
jgi:putative (di)nucleoside polyphosphate hydrolase